MLIEYKLEYMNDNFRLLESSYCYLLLHIVKKEQTLYDTMMDKSLNQCIYQLIGLKKTMKSLVVREKGLHLAHLYVKQHQI